MIERQSIARDTYTELAADVEAMAADGWRCTERKHDRGTDLWIAKLERDTGAPTAPVHLLDEP